MVEDVVHYDLANIFSKWYSKKKKHFFSKLKYQEIFCFAPEICMLSSYGQYESYNFKNLFLVLLWFPGIQEPNVWLS